MTPETISQSHHAAKSESSSESDFVSESSLRRPLEFQSSRWRGRPGQPERIDTGEEEEKIHGEEGEEEDIVHSPTTKLQYDISNLPMKTKSQVQDTFREPPQISLHHCRFRDGVYAFQLSELVPHSIRIGSRGSQHSSPTCSCISESATSRPENDIDSLGVNKSTEVAPCKHLLWLFDHVAGQTTAYEHEPGEKPLKLNTKGYANEMGDPYQKISSFHLDVLADGLHCTVVPENGLPSPISPVRPSSTHGFAEGTDLTPGDDSDVDEFDDDETSTPNPLRVLEAREILSSIVNSYKDKPVESWRPDLSGTFSPHGRNRRNPGSQTLICRGDLEATIFRMLISNDNMFKLFVDQLGESDPIKNRFRKLGQRVDKVLSDLDAYSASLADYQETAHSVSSVTANSVGFPEDRPSGCRLDEAPSNVFWAANHILGAVEIINRSIFSRDEPLQLWEQRAVARTLVHILKAVVDRDRDFHPGPKKRDRNLFARLIGEAFSDGTMDRGDYFVLSQLNSIPPSSLSHCLDTLEDIVVKLADKEVPIRYVEELKSIIYRGKSSSRRISEMTHEAVSSARAGSKRRSQALERDTTKRKK